MTQSNDNALKILMYLEGLSDFSEVSVEECRKLSQLYQQLEVGSPYKGRVKAMLKKIMPLFSPDELRIQ